MNMPRICVIALVCALALTSEAMAQDQPMVKSRVERSPGSNTQPSLPQWDQLTDKQRELLIAPVKERWNNHPEARSRMYKHAQQWQQLPPEERRKARRGMKHWDDMSPEKREQMRRLFQATQHLPAEEKEKLRKQWHAMTPAEREKWLNEHTPKP